MNAAAQSTDTMIVNAARSCAKGWAEQSRESDNRTWRHSHAVPDADIDYVEHEVLARPMDHDEMVLFCSTFREEYDACMAQKAEREGWDEV